MPQFIALVVVAFLAFQFWQMIRYYNDREADHYESWEPDPEPEPKPRFRPVEAVREAVDKHRHPPRVVPLDDQDVRVINEVADRVFGPRKNPPPMV